MKPVLIIVILTLFCIQCTNHYDYSNTVNVDNSWNKKDTLNFNFSIKNSKENKNINFIIRNNNDYPFSNLYLFIKLKQGKNTLVTDTLNYRLADNTGKWLGTGMGSVKEIYLGYKKNFRFPKEGNYTISVTQGMRKDPLKGIEDFGITIE